MVFYGTCFSIKYDVNYRLLNILFVIMRKSLVFWVCWTFLSGRNPGFLYALFCVYRNNLIYVCVCVYIYIFFFSFLNWSISLTDLQELNLPFLIQNILRYDVFDTQLLAPMLKYLPTRQETRGQSLGWEDLLERNGSHFSILA